ncbi:hypothetical protein B9G98_00302 [Wickerhamiella sorbophila]|uniref:Transmembrane protein 135 N-terminal domain-containing protein n=1 Tax=Wickerhamiella sorbophila TaxID=45607 RepID=A0A2T0FCF1_9ASCO|nr:hypothetical protein B9G98_00302 [Wickerhamiella sorbophila]PRT52682.1 hypothetical protein B9G98_00302 [Wickerhamiella sorbophila]
MTAAYIVRFILTPREFEKLNALCPFDLSNQVSALHHSESKSAHVHTFVRQHTRLFLKTYGVGLLVQMAISARNPVLGGSFRPSRPAIMITSFSAVYRVLNRVLSNLARARLDGVSRKRAIKIAIPMVSALIAGSVFRILPAGLRDYIALYLATKAAEYVYNMLDDQGRFNWKPRIVGSWILIPIAMSQLFYTLICEPDCCPRVFRGLMLSVSQAYMPQRPVGYPDGKHWPTENEVLASVAEISRLKFPKFKSRILSPNWQVPPTLSVIAPVLEMALPSNTTMTGALLHPMNPNERTSFWSAVSAGYGSTTKYLLPLYLILGFTRSSRSSGTILASAIGNTFRTATFISMSVASAWSGIALSQTLLGTRMLPHMRFRIIGFMSGLWAFLDQVNGRPRALYAIRMAILSQYNMLIKRRGGKPLVKNGSTIIFSLAMAVIFAVYNTAPESISSAFIRKLCNWVQTGRYSDPSPLPPSDSSR